MAWLFDGEPNGWRCCLARAMNHPQRYLFSLFKSFGVPLGAAADQVSVDLVVLKSKIHINLHLITTKN